MGRHRAPAQALVGTQVARALLLGLEGSPEQAAGLLEWWVVASAAMSQGTLSVLPGLSLTEATRRTRRPSAARPRSMTRPSTLVRVRGRGRAGLRVRVGLGLG